jgi:hypothetical protein
MVVCVAGDLIASSLEFAGWEDKWHIQDRLPSAHPHGAEALRDAWFAWLFWR